MLPARLPHNLAAASLLAALLILATSLSGRAPQAAGAQGGVTAMTVRAALAPARVPLGSTTIVSGRVEGIAAAGVEVELLATPYPSRAPVTVSRTSTAADGSYSFPALAEERNTRLQVLVSGASAAASPATQLIVEPRAALAARDLGAGRTRLSLRLAHAGGFAPAAVPVYWTVRARGAARFVPATVGSSREIAGDVTYASAVIDPPSRRFTYRVCLNPTWEHAMGTRGEHGRCPSGPWREGTATGTPSPPFPRAAAVAAAARFLDGRAGRTAFAVMDSAGRISGLRVHEHFESASVVKVMMLTAFLQMLAHDRRPVSAQDEALLYPMIHVSDNEAASAVLARVGEGALERVAREAGMRDYAPGVGWWAFTQTSPSDQVRLFTALPRLIPPRFYGYARHLLSTIEPSQSWGIPPVARPAWEVFFKTGALPSRGLFNEAARLERGPVTFAVAVFTDGDPSMAYGEETIAGVGRALLSRAP